MHFQVVGDPHPWPKDGKTPVTACAVIVVDMQNDYCSAGYYIDKAGYDTKRLSQPIEPIQSVLSTARRNGLQVFYTRHARKPEPGQQAQSAPGLQLPRTAAKGEPGWQIVPALTPTPADIIIEKTTCSAFFSGELDRILRKKGIRQLAFCGNTIDVCVHSSLRAAVDLDYECLLLGDCCGAVNEGLHQWALESIKIENGVFGTVASSDAFINAFSKE